MLTMESLYRLETTIALSNGTIAAPYDPPPQKNGGLKCDRFHLHTSDVVFRQITKVLVIYFQRIRKTVHT